jgi:predicted dehydrogenase
MTTTHCRWGILSTANIARKNWQAILDSGNGQLVAVASRDAAKSAKFIAECQAQVPHPAVPAALGSYSELIAAPGIDALYIPLPTGMRKEWVIRAAEAGKHVLVEKPVGTCTADVAEMIAACKANGVQFMDGVMFMHSARIAEMRRLLDKGDAVGRIRRIATQFSFNGDDAFLGNDIRGHGTLEPMGCLGDLGWYCIRFTLWAMGYAMPEQVTGRIHTQSKQSDGLASVPTDFSGELFFADGVSAAFFTSFHAQNTQLAHISGSRGYMAIDDFVLPFTGQELTFNVTQSDFIVDGCNFAMHSERLRVHNHESANNAPDSQEANMFRTFGKLVLSGQCDDRWPDIALKTQRIMDACLASAQQCGTAVAIA